MKRLARGADLKAGALAGGTLHADGAAHQVHDVFGDGHAKAGALHLVGAGALFAGKGVKKGLLVGLAHANAVILHHTHEERDGGAGHDGGDEAPSVFPATSVPFSENFF